MSNSPFEIFRRNLKPLMVLLTLLALFAFVVLPALDSYLRRGGGIGGDPVAASFDGIEVTGSRVTKLTQTHLAVVRFLGELATETMRRGGVPQTPGFRYDEQSGQIQSLGIDGNPSAANTIDTLKFANEARKAGFDLDDTAIEIWLTRFSDGTLSDSEITQILMRSTNNQLGVLTLYEQLRMHLLADLYQRAALVGLSSNNVPVVTPVGQWQNFLKLNQEATINAYGVAVSDFLEKTDPNPSESALQEVYEEGKERIAYPDDTSPEPKFKRPDSARFEYLAADLNALRKREIEKLSEEQLRQEYQRRVAGGDFQMPVESEGQPTGQPTGQDGSAAPGDSPDEQRSGMEPSATEESESTDQSETVSESEPVPSETDDEDQPADDTPPAGEQTESTAEESEAADEADPATQPGDTGTEPAAEDAEDAETTDEENEPAGDTDPPVEEVDQEAEPAAEDNSFRSPETALQLVAFQDESATDSPASPEADSTPPDSTPETATSDEGESDSSSGESTESDVQASPETETSPDTAIPSADDPAPTDDPASADEPAPAGDPAPADDDAPADDAAPAGETDELALEEDPMRQQSFEEVRDEIAASLAEAPAQAALRKAVTEVNSIMRRYFNERSIHESNVSAGVSTEADAPERPDLKALAKEYGLKAGETQLVNRVSVQQTAPGGSFGLGETQNQRGFPFAAKMFGAQMRDGRMIPPQPPFAPIQTVDIENEVTYVTWKTEDVPSYIPTLEEIRDEVVLAVRTRQARELAQAEAERIAREAIDRPLSEVLSGEAADDVMTDLGPFSWLNQVGFMQTTIGNVEQLDNVGQAFMQAVFNTQVGGAAVGPNQPRSVFYVVKPTKFQPDVEELRERFKQPQQRFMALLLGNEDARELVRGFYQSVDQRTGFEMNLPDQE